MPVKCRKCGGDHFTSKCGKDQQKKCIEIKKEKPPIKEVKKRRSRQIKNPFYNNRKNLNISKVKLSNIPRDITLQNLNKNLLGWGKIGNVKIRKNYREKYSYAIIEFYDKDAANYFIKAMDRTPMGFMMLNVNLI
jgi:hypothetical protein